jgi:hypothetical protein
MKTYFIPESIRQRAYDIATQRDAVAKDHGRIDGKFHDDYSSLEVNWQGMIAELLIQQHYPVLDCAQPFVIDDANTLAGDFTYESLYMEVKCNRFYTLYPQYFINVDRFHKKRHLITHVICTAINEAPSNATEWHVFGGISVERVTQHPIIDEYSSPAYAVPIEAFTPFMTILREGR